MSEPTRWRDEGPDGVRALLRAAPRTRDLTAEDRARGRKRLARTTALLAAAGATAWLQGAALGAGLGVAVVGAAWVAPAWLSGAPAPAPVIASAPSAGARGPASAPPIAPIAPTAPTAPSTPPASASAEPPPARPATRPEEPAAAGEAHAPPRDSLAEEAALIERARAALGPNAAEALALTEVHAAQFASGKLAMERELVAIDALRRLGRSSEARARGEALLSRARGGLYEERIRKLLDGAR